eukprot:3494142-Rhodomonas_salina.1
MHSPRFWYKYGAKCLNAFDSAGLGLWVVKTLVEAHGGRTLDLEPSSLLPYAVSGTDLRACYAMSGTGPAYGATPALGDVREWPRAGHEVSTGLAYGPMRCAVLAYCMVLCAVCGPGIAYGAMCGVQY